jgi:hypothetical protein
VQVDPIKPTLKPPRTKRLKRKCDEPLSNFAFNINLRRYTEQVVLFLKDSLFRVHQVGMKVLPLKKMVNQTGSLYGCNTGCVVNK